MSGYTKTAWVDGGVPALSAANLNKMETEGEHALGIDSLSALRALPVPTFANRCWARGHTTVNDGGAGPFDWDATCADADNDGTVILPTGHSGSGRWVRNYENIINVKWFGAKGDDATNDFDAFMAATATAVANDEDILIPPGSTYILNNSGVDIKAPLYGCNVWGYGATLKTTDAAGLYYSSVLLSYKVDTVDVFYEGKTIAGLTIDAGGIKVGMSLSQAHHYQVIDCTVINAVKTGIHVESSNNIVIEKCHVNGVVYRADNGGSADGIYVASCEYAIIINNHVEDFRRIGIVSEGGATDKSVGTICKNNIVHNANNCDDSATEYNAGIWYENTNGGIISGNNVYDISGNTGQTSGRVNGVVFGSGGSQIASMSIDNNTIDGHVVITPTSDLSTVFIKGNFITGQRGRISIKSVKTGYIIDNHFSGSHASLIQVDLTAAGSAIGELIIKGITHDNYQPTDGNEAALSLFNLTDGLGKLVITDCVDFSIVNRSNDSGIEEIFVTNSSILHGSDGGYGTFKAGKIYVSNCDIRWRGAATLQTSFITDDLNRTNAHFSNCYIANISTTLKLKTDGSYYNFSDCKFSGCDFIVSNGVEAQLIFNGCSAIIYPSTGFLQANALSGTEDTLSVRDCDFQGTDTVIQKTSFEMSRCILQGNSYESTALTDLTATSEVNNVKF